MDLRSLLQALGHLSNGQISQFFPFLNQVFSFNIITGHASLANPTSIQPSSPSALTEAQLPCSKYRKGIGKHEIEQKVTCSMEKFDVICLFFPFDFLDFPLKNNQTIFLVFAAELNKDGEVSNTHGRSRRSAQHRTCPVPHSSII